MLLNFVSQQINKKFLYGNTSNYLASFEAQLKINMLTKFNLSPSFVLSFSMYSFYTALFSTLLNVLVIFFNFSFFQICLFLFTFFLSFYKSDLKYFSRDIFPRSQLVNTSHVAILNPWTNKSAGLCEINLVIYSLNYAGITWNQEQITKDDDMR